MSTRPLELECQGSLARMATKRDESGREMWVPLKKVLTDPQSTDFYDRYADQFEALGTRVPFLTVLETMSWAPERFLSDLNIPIHITLAGEDAVNPPQESRELYERAQAPKELLEVSGATHYELYEGPLLDQVNQAQTNWFRRSV